MYILTCNYCGEEIIFSTMDQKPDICSNCNSSLQNMTVDKMSTVESENATIKDWNNPPKIILIYQKTGEEIHISPKDKIIIGTESYGHEVLSKISYISRIHCAIDYIKNEYIVTDLNSKNGTFVGISRIDCKLNPKQILKDGELLFLGKEAFLVKLEKNTDIISNGKNIPQESQKPIKYRCRSCGAESDLKEKICKACNAYDMMEIIES